MLLLTRMPKSPSIDTHFVRARCSDETVEKLKGEYQGEDDYDMIFDTDCDVYIITDVGEKKLLAKFRKNLIPAETVQIGWDAFHKMASQSLLRGAASGPVDISGAYYKDKNLTDTKGSTTSYKKLDGTQSKMRISNAVASSIVGFMDTGKFAHHRACRLSAYTAQHLSNYKHGCSFICAIDSAYKLLLPDHHKKQKARADMKPQYRIEDTAFSTMTINRNFRTGCHRDAGDYPDGFGNLTVIEHGDYSGGYTVFPQYGVGFDVRTGDVLLMDVHQVHANTEIYETPKQAEANAALPKIYKPNKTVGGNKNFTRLSFVCYLRNGLASCPDTISHMDQVHHETADA